MRIAVVGAGMAGLVSALRLKEAGHDVVIYERDSVPGGLAAGFIPVEGGAALERFYHHIFRSDTAIIGLIEELGLSQRLVWKHPVTTCLYEGKLYPLDSPSSLLRFQALPMIDRLRLGGALGALKASPTVTPFENRKATQWLKRVAGKRAFETVFEPLFRSKFGSYVDDISLGWFWARIHDRTPDLGYLVGGFYLLYQALADRLESLGVAVRFKTSVTRIERDGQNLRLEYVSGSDSGSEEYDRVVATVPLRVLQRIAPAISADYVTRYSPIASLWANCIILALDRPLTDAYWINICERTDREMPFMVLVEHTNFIDAEYYGGKHLVYIGKYSETEPPQRTIEELTPHLKVLNPAFSLEWVSNSWQFKAPFAQPIVTTHYRKKIAPHSTPVPGLFVANLEQIYPHDRGQNYAITLADRLIPAVTR